MRNKVLLSFVTLFTIILLSGCYTTKTISYKTKVYTPVYQSIEEFRNGVKTTSARELERPGKIYIFGKYLFICESGQGVHIIDDGNPASPNPISFIEIPGNGDIAVRDGILYADSYIDLVAIDIKDPLNPTIVKRVKDIFPNPLDLEGSYIDPEKGILIRWDVRDTTITYEVDGNDYVVSPMDGWKSSGLDYNGGPIDVGNIGGSSGKGGSMARFTTYLNYLYVVDRSNLQSIDISIPENPRPWNKVNIGWNIETIFPFRDKLFIGSQTGMFIYDASTPWNPTYLGQFSHARGCDPVVAEDKYAYVTLRTGTSCAGNLNQLDILDITNLMKPILLKSYPMQEPAGVGIDGTTLFICDGKAGLKVFDVKDPMNIELLNWQSDIQTYDIIPLGKIAIMIGSDGLFQYDYSDPKNLILLSKIDVKR
ncbi:MAG: hypothetical protein A2X61_02660 [Ignavibacteria bacterium GWB2_35_12]|nr:MAG: hypothetical protein A2X61_02660 [Ignavibacteria bacterium GWB2_35_12]OGU89883.1 MAG: hypothetical protein A2220_05820 [Ignavibacteria bacterium RIFOXYA2_FULL_35_10]OGV24259.1 MAG: hypothetical protein A2475_08585 [Ignavibacteria bacterium RIFOXYC2_FULL_35_21]